MKNDVKNYQVVILGNEYTIASDQSEIHVMQAANYVHSLMQEIVQKAPKADHKKVAVLTALRLASNVINFEEVTKQYNEKNIEMTRYINRELL